MFIGYGCLLPEILVFPTFLIIWAAVNHYLRNISFDFDIYGLTLTGIIGKTIFNTYVYITLGVGNQSNKTPMISSSHARINMVLLHLLSI